MHFGNNKAQLAGSGLESDASGKAVVKFVDGGSDDENPDLFNGAAVVYDLMAGVGSNLVVRGGGMETEICDGLANAQGTFRCSGQMVTVNRTVSAGTAASPIRPGPSASARVARTRAAPLA